MSMMIGAPLSLRMKVGTPVSANASSLASMIAGARSNARIEFVPNGASRKRQIEGY